MIVLAVLVSLLFIGFLVSMVYAWIKSKNESESIALLIGLVIIFLFFVT